jgi:regulator of RNase E activity RraA
MDGTLLELLTSVDTPTVCNAIEVVQGKRGFGAFTRVMPVATAPDAPAIVGYASTAKIAGRFPSPESPESIRQRRMEYYRHMASTPKPAVVVVEDIDFPECVGAFWGEINATVHKGFGLAGVVTNGLVRDLGDLPEDFPILAGSVGPSHAFVHVTGFGLPVEVMGLAVAQGDLIHADRHGALVIPPDVVPRLAEGIRTLTETERTVLETARSPDFDLRKFEDAWARFERART